MYVLGRIKFLYNTGFQLAMFWKLFRNLDNIVEYFDNKLEIFSGYYHCGTLPINLCKILTIIIIILKKNKKKKKSI